MNPIARELYRFLFLFLYLFLFFSAMSFYRLTVLPENSLSSVNYVYDLVKASVLAKVIHIGIFFKLGDKFHDKPLIVPTLYKSFVFCLFVIVFAFLEHVIKGFFLGQGFERLSGLCMDKVFFEIVSRIPLFFAVAIPLFSLEEVGTYFGGEKVFLLFFRRKKPYTKEERHESKIER